MTTYQGGCHCGKIRYEINADFDSVMSCNCSICQKRGYLLAFVPQVQFKLLTGSDSLQDYQFNKMNVHHLFCKNCGIASFGQGTAPDGKPMCAINVRCLDGIDLAKFSVKYVDGRSF